MLFRSEVFYQDEKIIVSNSRFVVDKKTYSIRNISSVKIGRSSRMLHFILLFFGMWCCIPDGWIRIMGAVLVIGSIYQLVAIKRKYTVRIITNSSEFFEDVFVSTDSILVEKIVNAVNKAIVTNTTQYEIPRPTLSRNISISDELQKLADLKSKGLLTEKEFNAQKAKLLS